MTKPHFNLHEVVQLPSGLGRYTWEQRRTMTAKELTLAMGALHVNHKDYKPRLGSLFPVPNLVYRPSEYEIDDTSFIGVCKAFIRWAAR